MPTPVSRLSLVFLSALVFPLLGAPLSAQSDESTGFLARLHGGFSPSTEFDKAPIAEMSVYRAGLDLEYHFAVGTEASAAVGVGSEIGTYDYDELTVATGPQGGSFTHYAMGSLYGSYARQLDAQTGLVAQARIMSGMDIGAKVGDSFTFGVMGGATTKVDDSLTIGLGVGVVTRLEHGAMFYPVPIVDWKIDDRWRLHTDHVLANASGFEDLSGLRLNYATSEEQDCYLGVGWQIRQLRLDDDAYDPYTEGALLDNRVSVYGGTTWRVQHNADLFLNLGYNLKQEFDTAPATGPSPADLKTDPAPFFSLGVEFRF